MKPISAAVVSVIVMMVALAGFYPTYISKFPEFEGLQTAHHFHGFMMVSWFIALVAQPLLIKNNKIDWHKIVGRASYVIATLVVVSIYWVTRLEYYDDLSKYTRQRTLAGLDIDLLSMLSFTILYSLAIYYKRQLPYHMRYMICTGLLIFVPGLGRLLTISLGFSGMSTGIIILIITFGSYLGLIVFDKLKRNPVSPYWVGLALVALTNFTVATNKTGWWQWTAGKVASLIF